MTENKTDPGPILGIDQSLVACGCAILPEDWRGDWSTVDRQTIGFSLPAGATTADHINRLEFISGKVLAFARKHGVRHVALESHPFGKNSCAHSLGRLAGVLLVDLTREGLDVHVVPISSARRLLLTKLPRKAAKEAIVQHWGRLRAPWATHDECDAACAANYLSAQLGGSYFEGMRLWLPRETEAAS